MTALVGALEWIVLVVGADAQPEWRFGQLLYGVSLHELRRSVWLSGTTAEWIDDRHV